MSSRLERAWYRQAPWLKLFRPVSVLFTCLVKRRRQRWLQSKAVWHAPVPVIVVGNISVGGTGKTPVVLALIEWLRSEGYQPGVVSRGYGAKPPSYPWLVKPEQDASLTGDEPLLIAQRAQVKVVIDPDRPAAARALLAGGQCNVIISDDGLQHYPLGRDIEIAVIDGQRGLGNRRCLPEGPLREPPERLNRVDLVLQNGGDMLHHPAANIFQLQATRITRLDGSDAQPLAQWLARLKTPRVHAVCGIGHPERFFSTLAAVGLDCVPHAFADHHAFSEAELLALDGLPLVMTEKDAVKCKDFQLPDGWVLQVTAELPDRFKDILLQQLAACQFKEGKGNG